MDAVMERYGIDVSLSVDAQLTLLEKERQKVLRKLNHVFGNPHKEKELGDELDRMEAVIAQLEQVGGKILSMEDVTLETRALSQTQITFSEEDAPGEEEASEIARIEKIRKLQALVMQDQGRTLSVCIPGIRAIADFYESRKAYASLETWLTYGAQWVPDSYFVVRLYRLFRARTDEGADPNKRFYWTKRAADMGDRDACYDLACRYFKKGSSSFDPQEAGYYFAKAAGRDHQDAYLHASAAFSAIKDYRRAELCLETADKRGIAGAAYRMALMFDGNENTFGSRNIGKAIDWYEKACKENSDGDICFRLGKVYIDAGRKEDAARVLERGVREHHSADCKVLLETLS